MNDSSREEYNRLAAVYDQRWDRYVRISLDRVLGAVVLDGDERVLDVGCGTGVLLEQLRRRHPGLELQGIDPSEGMLEIARKRCGADVSLAQGQAEKLPYPADAFDVIVSVSALHYFAEPPQAIAEMHRVLRPAGRVVIVDWCADFFAMRLFARWLRLRGGALGRIHRVEEIDGLLKDHGFRTHRLERFRIRPLWGMMTVVAGLAEDPVVGGGPANANRSYFPFSGIQASRMTRERISVMSSMAYRTPSRPRPLSLTPP